MTTTATRTPARAGDTSSYVGALDGLRAIAVAAVIVYHFAPKVLPAGFLGVDVFFVVSGFLIARLVVREIDRSGTVSLGHFWARRVRRLLPALATVTVAVLVAAAISLTPAEIHSIRAQALGTLFYCANWVMIAGKSNYFANLGRPSPFLHMWTLAVEEQFYVVLPLVLFATRRAVVRRPGRAAIVALVLAVASTVWMAVLVTPGADPSRAYLGSDSHAMGLLVGVALGIVAGIGPWPRVAAWAAASAGRGRAVNAAAAGALLAIVVVMRIASDRSLALYRGGFLGFSVLCAVIIAVVVAVPAAGVTRLLRTRALVEVGLRSYSLYLWHWPVRVFVTARPGLDGFGLFVARLAISAVLAEASFRLVERPFRSGVVATRAGSRPAIAFYGALVIVSAVLVATVAAPQALPPSSLAQVTHVPGNAEPSALRVDTFGDSTALVFGLAGADNARALGISVGGDAELGCGVVQTEHVSAGRTVDNPPVCAGWRARWQAAMRKDPSARLALMTGAWEVLDQRTSNGVVRFGTQAWTDLVALSMRDALDVLSADGRVVYVFEVPCYGAGDVTEPFAERSDPRRIDALNTIIDGIARTMPHVEIVHWRSFVCPGGKRAETIDGVHMWQADEQHLSADGAVLVWKWWLPQLRAKRG